MTIPMGSREVTGDDLFDLPAGLGQRVEGVRFDILTSDLEYAFTCREVDRTSKTPTIHFDANADVNRTISSMWFGPGDTAKIDPFSHLLAPKWVLDDGTTKNYGVFHFANLPLERHSYGDVYVPALYDSSVILNQERGKTFSIQPGTLLTTGARRLIEEVGLSSRAAIDNSAEYVTGPAAQVFAGSMTRKQMLSAICEALGFYPPYFDNDGFLRLRAVPNPLSEAKPDFKYVEDENSRIIRDSVQISSNIIDAPNVYKVIGSPTGAEEVVGVFYVPASAPHSVQRRGWEQVKSIQNQDIHSKPAADVAAQAAYVNDFSTYLEVQVETAAEPRSDGMQVIAYRNVNYREQSTDLAFKTGGTMRHSWQKVWQPI